MNKNVAEQVHNIQEHIIKKCDDVDIINDPYPHMIVDNFFPTNIACKIDNLFPDVDHAFFDSIDKVEDKKESSHLTKQKRYRRSFFSPDTNKPLLECILDEVFNEELLLYFLRKYNKQYDENYGWGAHYVWDYNVAGCDALAPHVDAEAKILSFVYYVPTVSFINGRLITQDMQGTDILIQNNDGSFTEHTYVEAKRNRCLIFEKSTRSWHAVKETKNPRRTITAFIIDKRLDVDNFAYMK